MTSFTALPRVGFACKIQKQENEAFEELSTTSTKITWLSKQTKEVAVQKLLTIMEGNCRALKLQIEWVALLPANQRMFRITSDLLPAYTHKDWAWLYKESSTVNYLAKALSEIGNIARQNDIRLSFHPGQFCVLASDNPEIVKNSIEEFEYHTDIARYMGYGKQFQDFKCNVHISGRAGPEGIQSALLRMTPEARNIITIENAEFSFGLEHSLELAKDCALVLDIHHHWIYSDGEFISPNDERFKRVVDSWRGVRPVIHYSLPKPESPQLSSGFPDMQELKKTFKATELRAHSDYYNNSTLNSWAASFSPYADIMCEAKQKNLASAKIAELI